MYDEALVDTEASLVLLPTSFKALRTRARINLHLEKLDAAVADFKSSIEQAEFENADVDVRSLRAELKKAEAALKRSKTKDYYKILGWSLSYFVHSLSDIMFRHCKRLLRCGHQKGIPSRKSETSPR